MAISSCCTWALMRSSTLVAPAMAGACSTSGCASCPPGQVRSAVEPWVARAPHASHGINGHQRPSAGLLVLLAVQRGCWTSCSLLPGPEASEDGTAHRCPGLTRALRHVQQSITVLCMIVACTARCTHHLVRVHSLRRFAVLGGGSLASGSLGPGCFFLHKTSSFQATQQTSFPGTVTGQSEPAVSIGMSVQSVVLGPTEQ